MENSHHEMEDVAIGNWMSKIHCFGSFPGNGSITTFQNESQFF